jgi:hypothetical protein
MTEVADLSPTDASNTAVGAQSLDGNIANMSSMDDTLQAILGMLGRWTSSDTLASAATTDIGAQAETYLAISGTTTITALGTVRAGTIRVLKFNGALTLTHNATSLILPGAANITTAAGDTAGMVSEGSGNWRCLAYQRAAAVPAGEYGHPFLHVRDEKVSGTVGGNLTGGIANTRDINTVVLNQITNSSIGSNQIVLPAGTYYAEANAPAFAVGRHRLILTNATDAVTIIVGPNCLATVAQNAHTTATVSGRFTLAATKSLYISHWCETTNGTSGGGAAMSDGNVEVYAEAKFWRLK